jgi:hypothetical protein
MLSLNNTNLGLYSENFSCIILKIEVNSALKRRVL